MRRSLNRMPAYSHAVELVAKDIDTMLARMIEEHGLANVPTIEFNGSRSYRDALITTIHALGVKARRKGVRGTIVIDVASWLEIRGHMKAKAVEISMPEEEEIVKDAETVKDNKR